MGSVSHREKWKTLIDTGKQCPALVEPNPFNNMIVHMPYWSRTEFVYGINYTCIEVCPIKAYTVDLYYGHIQNRNKNERAFILPVRPGKRISALLPEQSITVTGPEPVSLTY